MTRRTTQHSSRTAQRTLRYHDIANTLRTRIAEGKYAHASVLPSESDMSKQFGASRATVRRALEVLRDEGLVTSRQGRGWQLATGPMPQSLGRLGTIEEQLLASGARSARQIVDFAFEKAPKRIAQLLNTEQVLRVKRVNLADDEPFAVVTVWCSLALGRKLSRRDVEQSSFYELIDVPLKGATQTIGADAASKTEARLLATKPGSPVLRCERTTRDMKGNVVLYSQHVFPAHRTNFVVDLPSVAQSIAPSGLRLVE